MKTGFFPRLAWQSIRKNGRLYIPYWITCAMCVCMFYLMQALSRDPYIRRMRGGYSTSTILMLGSIVTGLFSVIFIFYTNSFIMRRRRREFGLYSVLGMDKRSLTRVLMWENAITMAVTVASGLVCGTAVSKLGELLLMRLVGDAARRGFFLSPQSVFTTLVLFGAIFFVLLITGAGQVRLAAVTELLHSENAGEKPPKGNVLIAAGGMILLGAAYAMAVSIQQPLTALLMFFVAVIMVIVATYLLMISGSVTLCRLLQKNRKYYYKTRHFVSVSSMVYRMKRNGAGLASICILATMVLVMTSTTSCLYFSADDILNDMYPREICAECELYSLKGSQEIRRGVTSKIHEAAAETGCEITNVADTVYATTAGLLEDGVVTLDSSAADSNPALYDRLAEFCFIGLDDYNRQSGGQIALDDGEALVYSPGIAVGADTLTMGPVSFRVAGVLDSMVFTGVTGRRAYPIVYLLVNDLEKALAPLMDFRTENGIQVLSAKWVYSFDAGLSSEGEADLRNRVFADPGGYFQQLQMTCREEARDDLYGSYGGFFFLGILLSLVFLTASVIIIYYKQLSEAYEDMGRYEILRKLGMTDGDIRASVNSQMLTVFFFPLGLAVVHLCFAFPMIRRLLLLFGMNNQSLLFTVTAISVGAFSLLYAAVYRAVGAVAAAK